MVITALSALGLALFSPLIAHAQTLVPPPQQGVTWVNRDYAVSTPSYLIVMLAGCRPNQPYDLYVFTQDQYNAWSSGNAAKAVYTGELTNGAPIVINLGPGNYVAVIYPAPGNYRDCLVMIGPSQGLGMGLTSLPGSPLITNEVLGYFNFSSIAINATGNNQPGLNLQLSAIAVLQLANGDAQYYLVSDVLTLMVQSSHYSISSIILNETSTWSVLNGVTGNGEVTGYGAGEVYEYSMPPSTYEVPFSGYLIINTTASGNSAVIEFGYVVIRNGTYEPPRVVWFDNVTISPGTPVINAFIEAYSDELTGSGSPMSLELALGGYGGETVTLNSLKAELALAYQVGPTWVSPPNLYDYSLNPTGYVNNVEVTMNGPLALLSTGQLDPGLVDLQSLVLFLPMTYVAVCNPVTNSTSTTYIVKPYAINQDQVIYVDWGVRYVLTGYYVNGEFVGTTLVIKPGSWFQGYYVVASYRRQYLVAITSSLPVEVNGMVTTNYTNWLDAGSPLSIEVSRIILGNGTMLMPSISNETMIINSPLRLRITWAPYYLVSISSPIPITINKTTTINYVNWVARGSKLIITANNVVLNNGTMLKPSISNEAITVNSPMNISIKWTTYYLITVTSPLPIDVNGVMTRNYTEWLSPGSVVSIMANNVTLGNGTMLRPLISSEAITVNSPVTITVNWVPYYLVSIVSDYPINVNGSLVRNYTNYVMAGSTLIIKAKPITRYLGLITLDPNVTSLTLVIDRPIRLTITYTPNYVNAALLIILAALAIAVMAIVRPWSGKRRDEPRGSGGYDHVILLTAPSQHPSMIDTWRVGVSIDAWYWSRAFIL